MRVLCLDIEGGYGGSSRSLFESIQHMDKDDLEVEVWCRRKGPIQDRYVQAGIPCRVTPDMPHVSSLPRLSRNLYAYGRYFLHWSRSKRFRAELAEAANERFDVVHFNHSGLFLLASWLRRRTDRPLVMHIRTHLPPTLFSRWQHRLIARRTDQRIFISENERDRTSALAGFPVEGKVIYNIVTPNDGAAPHPAVPRDSRFKVASLSNYAWVRGVDRLIDVARALAAQGRRDVLFVVAGRMNLPRSLPGDLGRIGAGGGTLEDYATLRGVGDMFAFLGHVDAPEQVLAAADLVLRPSRGNNPWGREVLEALAAGKPVLSIGAYDRFVEDGVTGRLFPDFDADETARAIVELMDDPARVKGMAKAASERIAALCDGPSRAADLLSEWRTVRHHNSLDDKR